MCVKADLVRKGRVYKVASLARIMLTIDRPNFDEKDVAYLTNKHIA